MPNVQVGDWICFMNEGRLVISEVRYLKTPTTEKYAITDIGSVPFTQILEIRRDATRA